MVFFANFRILDSLKCSGGRGRRNLWKRSGLLGGGGTTYHRYRRKGDNLSQVLKERAPKSRGDNLSQVVKEGGQAMQVSKERAPRRRGDNLSQV